MSSSSSSVSSATSPSLLSSASSSSRSSPPPLDKGASRVLSPSRRQWEAQQSSASSSASSISSYIEPRLPPSPSRASSTVFFLGNSSTSLSSSTVGEQKSHHSLSSSSYVDASLSSPPSPARISSAAASFSSSSASAPSSSVIDGNHSHKVSSAPSSSSLKEHPTSQSKGNQAPPSPRSLLGGSLSGVLGFFRRGSNPNPEKKPAGDEDPGIGPAAVSKNKEERPKSAGRKPSESDLYLSSVLAISGSNQQSQTGNNEDDYKRGGPIGQMGAASKVPSIVVDAEAEPGSNSEVQLSPRAVDSVILDATRWTEDEFYALRGAYENPDIKCSVSVICRLRERGDLDRNGKVTCLEEAALREYYKSKLEVLIQETDPKDQKFVRDTLLKGCNNPHFKWVSEPFLALRPSDKEIKLKQDLIKHSFINPETGQLINPRIVASIVERATFKEKK